jgi:protein-disulfide isomerase
MNGNPNRNRSRPTRRRLLGGLTGVAAALAGCSGGSGSSPSNDQDGQSGGDGEGGDGESIGAPVRGDPGADVTLAVYEDFACPHCKDYNENGYPALKAEYVATGRIRYEHRDLPIPVLDPESYEAANAARAVQDRGDDEAFWTYADELFARQSDIGGETPVLYGDLVEGLVASEAVQEAAVDQAYSATVERDRQRGVDAGVEGTPGFVVDGEVVTSGFGESTVGTVTAALDERL